MYIILIEVFLSGNKGEVIVLYLKNIKLDMNNKKDKLVISLYWLLIISMLMFGFVNHDYYLAETRSLEFIKGYIFISLWCIGYVLWSFIFFIHKTIDPNHFKYTFGDDTRFLRIIVFPNLFAVGFSSFLYEYLSGMNFY
jgi:hypothetical protein